MVAAFEGIAEHAHDAATELTGLRSQHRPVVRLVSRPEWAVANVESARRMLRPILQHVRLPAGGIVSGLGRRGAAIELGAVLGILSKHVLGQYDLTASDAAEEPNDEVLFVRPNVLETEKRFNFRPEEFRKWIAFHELTHHLQFRGVPWLSDYFQSRIADLAGLVDPDPRRAALAITRLVESLLARRSPFSEGGLVGLFATTAQRESIERLQALMTVVEGHATWVMNELGSKYTETSDRMAATLSQRRESSPSLIARMIGMEQKARQYDAGERFFQQVAREAGSAATRRVWQGPAFLPTTTELDDPVSWLTRVNGELTPAGHSLNGSSP